jgi:hypothetical protein
MFYEQKLPPWTKNPVHFPEGFFRIFHRTEQEGCHHGIEPFRIEGEGFNSNL